MAIIFFLLGVLALGVSSECVRLPAPTGNYSAGHAYFKYTDCSRREPFNKDICRSIAVHHFFPIPKTSPSDDNYGAPPTLRALEASYDPPLPEHSLDKITVNSQYRPLPKSKPSIIFSHGGGTSVLVSQTLLEDLASHGYHVAAVDHPYDAAAVTYPDEETVYVTDVSNFTLTDWTMMLETRVMDLGFVIDTLGIEEIVALGHSLGGSTAIEAARRWPNVIHGAANMDGAIFNTSNPSLTPVLLLETADHVIPHPEWKEFEDAHKVWTRRAEVVGFEHDSFADMGWVEETLNVGRVGNATGSRQVQVVRRFMGDFVEFVMEEGEGVLVNGRGGKKWRDVIFEEK